LTELEGQTGVVGSRQVPLASVSVPKQARSEQTLIRLLDAAESLIRDKGLGAVSVPEIVSRAGSSVGGFYARFKDKDELLLALEERFLRRDVQGDLIRRVVLNPVNWFRLGSPRFSLDLREISRSTVT
jgi:AcrR family transcriptional regulator